MLVTWVKAHDTPLHRDDLSLDPEQLDAKRKRWLSFHDQRTAGILGLLPLVKGLPVRLTDSIDHPLKLFKHRRGVVVGWVLHADETSVPSGNQRVLDSTCEIDARPRHMAAHPLPTHREEILGKDTQP